MDDEIEAEREGEVELDGRDKREGEVDRIDWGGEWGVRVEVNVEEVEDEGGKKDGYVGEGVVCGAREEGVGRAEEGVDEVEQEYEKLEDEEIGRKGEDDEGEWVEGEDGKIERVRGDNEEE